jgi:hypothetical protein
MVMGLDHANWAAQTEDKAADSCSSQPCLSTSLANDDDDVVIGFCPIYAARPMPQDNVTDDAPNIGADRISYDPSMLCWRTTHYRAALCVLARLRCICSTFQVGVLRVYRFLPRASVSIIVAGCGAAGDQQGL